MDPSASRSNPRREPAHHGLVAGRALRRVDPLLFARRRLLTCTAPSGRPRVQYDAGVTEETLLVDAAMSEALAELEAFLEGVPEERAAELVLGFASRWVLPAAASTSTGFAKRPRRCATQRR